MATTIAALLVGVPISGNVSNLPRLKSMSFDGLKLSHAVANRRFTKRVQLQPAASGQIVAMAATLPVLTFQGEKAGDIEFDLKTARPETAKSVVHRGVITELQNRRRGTASTLTRAEVRGGGRKPYKQKGSGRARQGSIRTPLRPGGGVVFGPKPKDWSIKINKKEKRLAISTALQSAAVNTIVVEDFEDKFPTPKTKDFLAALKRWGIERSDHSLLFTTSISDTLILSSRNVNTFKLLTPRSLNLYDVLRADKLIITKSAVEYLNERYGASADFDELEEEAEDEAEEGSEEPEDAVPKEGEN